MEPTCPYCGETLEREDENSDYTCPNHPNEYWRVDEDTGDLYSPWGNFMKERGDNDTDVDPEDWRDYEDGKKTSW